MPGFKTNLFLSEKDLDNVSKWRSKVSDTSLSTWLMTPFWDWLAEKIPRSVAPNVITLAALCCVIQAFWLVVEVGKALPDKGIAALAAVLTYCYFTLAALDGKHARNIKNESPIGELFSQGMTAAVSAFQVVTLLKIMGNDPNRGWNKPVTQWYLVQTVQYLFLLQNLAAYNSKDNIVRIGFLSGPGELSHLLVAFMGLHALFGQYTLWNFFQECVVYVLQFIQSNITAFLPNLTFLKRSFCEEAKNSCPLICLNQTDGKTNTGDCNVGNIVVENGARLAFTIVVSLVAFRLVQMLRHPKKRNRSSGFVLIICLLVRCVPAVIMANIMTGDGVGATVDGSSDLVQTVSQGIFISILTSDIIVAKMAQRSVHSLVLIMTMASITHNFVIYACLFVYYGSVFGDMLNHMNLPLFSVITNVFCDGIFDLTHRGHMEQFRQAHSVVPGGTRLFVGVCSDKESTDYKRAPIMSEDERYAAVASCKYVHAVIKNSPISHDFAKPGEGPSRSEELIAKHNIHVYAVGREYKEVANGKKDYYALPRARNMIRYTERTGGISTSHLIRRIVERADEFLSSPKVTNEGTGSKKRPANSVPELGAASKKRR